MFSSRSRCRSRLWTPEHGADSWLTCTRGGAHKGMHHAQGESWVAAEAMADIAPPHSHSVVAHAAHRLSLARRAG